MTTKSRFRSAPLSYIVDYLRVSPQHAEVVISEITLGSTPAPGFYALISAASLIASLGLVANSAAVVIGAMLVSPLMTPIFGMAMGTVRGDATLLGRAIRAEIGGVILAIAFGALFGSLPLTTDVTAEMLSRTEPTLLDLLVAVFAGLAGTLAVLDERISPALPGVAISTAIVPPLATCGLCLAFGAFNGAYGAFLLFFANFLAILLVSSLVFILGGMSGIKALEERRMIVRRLLIAGVGFVVVAAVLTHTLVAMVKDRNRDKAIRGVFEETLRKEPTTSLDALFHSDHDGELHILATVRTPKVFSPDRVKDLEVQLAHHLDLPPRLIVRCVLAKDISPTGTTSGVTTPTLDGTFLNTDIDADVNRLQSAEQTLRELFTEHKQLLLLDVDLIHLSGEAVILASLQSSRALVPEEVAQFESRLQERLGDPTIRLLARCQVATDVTSRGRILFGRAHFGIPPEGAGKVELEIRRAVADSKDLFVTNVDAIWDSDHWSAAIEVVGPRVISPGEVQRIEKSVVKRVGEPVKLNAWSRVELMVTESRSMPVDELTRERFQANR